MAYASSTISPTENIMQLQRGRLDVKNGTWLETQNNERHKAQEISIESLIKVRLIGLPLQLTDPVESRQEQRDVREFLFVFLHCLFSWFLPPKKENKN